MKSCACTICGMFRKRARPSRAFARSPAPAARRGLPGNGAICRGVDVAIELDARRLEGTGVFLFASVIDRFLGLYASMNSFTRLTVRLHGREQALRVFPAACGRSAAAVKPRLNNDAGSGGDGISPPSSSSSMKLGARLRAACRTASTACTPCASPNSMRDPAMGRLGTNTAPAEEGLRLTAMQGLAFAPSEVVSLSIGTRPARPCASPSWA